MKFISKCVCILSSPPLGRRLVRVQPTVGKLAINYNSINFFARADKTRKSAASAHIRRRRGSWKLKNDFFFLGLVLFFRQLKSVAAHDIQYRRARTPLTG